MTTVQLIEDYVLDTVNYKFNELFKEWFELLVEDTSKTVRVDEKFNPIIQQNEFEQTFEWLSGGEKAGIALAYRLALNSLIRQQPTGFRPELLMLDEPTDGFSKEQLTKVSNILSDIENKQVIIVSHNQEFVKLDQIISVTKENDISRIDIQSYGD
uniref:DNA double-strand repair ATPase Rad50 (SbcC) n=1 Tax=uncultured marine thaumarchaeote AD1000_33_G09 TaxID=1455909 RepID=A0A075FNV1_9ARCH|nr:DNA double-strand repair ATPase Rad50 (sbcC) [uncultured marine thaumarchaeote AD1000_33_G09]